MDTRSLFSKLFKASDPASVLASLYTVLQSAPASAFTPALIEYTFFPISHLLRKPPIPNRVLEQVYLCLSVLCTHWDLATSPGIWTQLVILCNLAEGKDEETCIAASLTLHALFSQAEHPKDLPVIGKTLDTVLGYTLLPNHTLQSTALQVLSSIIETFPLDHVPAILPGVVSKMVRVAMGDKTTSQAVTLALNVLGKVLERGIGDEVCIQSGAIRDYTSLEDLIIPNEPLEPTPSSSPHRTPTWLTATSPQVHVSLLALSPLSSNPNPLTRLALVNLCTTLVHSCARSLDQSQPLLVTHLLVLAYPALEHSTVPEDAQKALEGLNGVDVQVVAGIVGKALSLLPYRLSHVHHHTASSLAKQLVSACHVLPRSTVGALLGPGGGIEKWGRTLLSVINFNPVDTRIVPLLQQITSQESVEEEAELTLDGLDTQTTNHIASLFRALGKKSGDQGVFAIEWFVNAGIGGSCAGLWCALWLLRGIQSSAEEPSKRVMKAVKWIARSLAEMWDDRFLPPPVQEEKEKLEVTEYVKGLNPLTTLLDRPSSTPKTRKPRDDKRVHSDLAIRLIVTCHSILATSAPTVSSAPNTTYNSSIVINPSITLLQYTIYPMLVESKGLGEVSAALGYARVENMLLANFDYALEAVARRVSVFSVYAAGLHHSSPSSSNSPSVSLQALQTLQTLIHLVGSQIVSRASDVIDECFDRLDDFHGYERVVRALVGVLGEVVSVVGREDDGTARDGEREVVPTEREDEWEGFLKWWHSRGKKDEEWEFDLGKDKGKQKEQDEEEPRGDEPPPLPPTQSLTRQIISRCTYFLTHPSPYIRSQILHLLTTAAPTLRASALLPTIHASWPFILNRMGDSEVWVVVEAVRLIERLVECVGEFMARRVWEDVWPRVEKMLKAQADRTLVKRPGPTNLRGFDTYGPRALADLQIAILGTVAQAVKHVEPSDQAVWSLLLLARRFLVRRGGGWGEKREEVYAAAVEMYKAVGKRNPDVVWLVLEGTKGGEGLPAFLKWEGEDISEGIEEVLNALE